VVSFCYINIGKLDPHWYILLLSLSYFGSKYLRLSRLRR
jgi:hypothetical protein